MLQTIGDNKLSPRTSKNEINNNTLATRNSIGKGDISSAVGRDVENQLISKLAKTKKPDLAKFQKSKLIEVKKLDFATAQISRTDFLILKAKKTFIHLGKAFTKVLILPYFNPKCHICIKIDSSGYTISGVLN